MCEKMYSDKQFRNQAFTYLLQLRMTLFILFSFHVNFSFYEFWKDYHILINNFFLLESRKSAMELRERWDRETGFLGFLFFRPPSSYIPALFDLFQLIVSTENEMLRMLIVIVPVKVKVNFITIHCEFHDQGDNVKR